ncbi:UDP-N-acetylglucosamine transferase subunit ALG13 [Pseudoclavibacter sp. JAI123]|uniref:glycosyltransferase n=1 Tax=Pseudoclavibacter sp. JAI123 TaxID=2723065 RepID=UPI001795589A|nr:glycosyltransferase [Pseudoclavibacter sp. JAI123]NYF12670.1 UDP-N-acetylglucosamine transferase subunit ALG13 [Pseudoclavibacter sp. JAI123]
MSEQRKLLLIASTGGHLAQLTRMQSRLGAAENSLWVTFDTEQSRSLLDGRRVLFVPYVAPRDWRSLLKAAQIIDRRLRVENFDGAVSTGAGLALAGLPLARRRGIPASYIESVSRVEGPSLSGRLLYASRLVKMHTQHSAWATGRWNPIPPVLAEYRTVQRQAQETQCAPKVFVTLGTIKPYRFDSLVDRLLETGVCGENTTWQLGVTDRDDLPGAVHTYMDAKEFESSAREADVVVTHAGVGTVMDLLNMGKSPVVVPRRAAHGEHVDDHQQQITSLLESLSLAVPVQVAELTAQHIESSRHRATLALSGLEGDR